MRAILLLLLALVPLQAADWPQWLGPARDGVWREDGILDLFPTAGPRKLWSVPVGLGYAGPAVRDGKVYIADRQLAPGSANPDNPFDRNAPIEGNERLLCLDAASGRILWTHDYPCRYRISYAAGPRCTPLVDETAVYMLGAMGDLICLEAATGRLKWKKNLVQDYGGEVPVWGFACHPLRDGDRLIVVGGGPEKLVIALNRLTGETIWTSQTCEGDFGYSPPMIYEFGGRKQLIVWHAQAVVGLELETGKRIWRVPFNVKAALTAPTPRKIGEQLFISSFYNGSMMLHVTADAAIVTWRSQARGERPNLTTDLSAIMCTPFIEHDHIYGVCSYGQLRCLKLDGQRLWSTMQATRGRLTPPRISASDEPADSERWSNAFIVKQDERFFLFNEQGELIIAKLSPAGYQELSRATLIEPVNTMAGRNRKVVWMHPAFADRKVFVRSDAEAACFDLAK